MVRLAETVKSGQASKSPAATVSEVMVASIGCSIAAIVHAELVPAELELAGPMLALQLRLVASCKLKPVKDAAVRLQTFDQFDCFELPFAA